MRIGVAAEHRRGERRVIATPEVVGALRELAGADGAVLVEQGAGAQAGSPDSAYEAAGAVLVARDALWSEADLVVKIGRPTKGELKGLRAGAAVLCWLDGDAEDPLLGEVAARGATLLALDAVPRITRAQVMDVRSSMAHLAGYRAVLEAATRFGRTLGPTITAAGSTPPARVLVIGVGVAGLAAIAAARALGAEVRAFDTRAAAREQAESLGARFLTVSLDEDGEGGGGYGKEMSQAFLDAEYALFRAQADEVDVVITTALIPGRPAPKLWHDDMLARMRPGGVVVDLAASRGGNCTATEPGKTAVVGGVSVVGETDLTQAMPEHASRLLANNLVAYLRAVIRDGALALDPADDVARCSAAVAAGAIAWPARPPEPSPTPAPRAQPSGGSAPTGAGPAATPRPATPSTPAPRQPARKSAHHAPPTLDLSPTAAVGLSMGGLVLALLIGQFAPADFVAHLTVFVLACFVGWQVVWNVTPALHTPLMAVTNAISGIIVVGAILQLDAPDRTARSLAFLAVLLAGLNIFGGFGVTHRMLGMFRKEGA